MLTGTNLQQANSYNKRIIMETIRVHGPHSRVGIARKTQLTAQTVTNITRSLIKAGLIVEDSKETKGRGAPSILLRINENAGFSIGVDFDNDHLTVVLIDFNGRICQKKAEALNFPSPEETIDKIASMVFSIIENEDIDTDKILGVGLGIPGPFANAEQSEKIRVVNPKAFPGWENVPIVRLLEERLQIPLLLENNASAAAIGEHWYGNGKHLKSFFYIYFGAGLGGGIVINSQLYSGATTNAGELGFFPTSAILESGQFYEHDHIGGYFNIPGFQEKLKKMGYSASNISDLEVLHTKNVPEITNWLDEGSKHLLPLILAIEYLIDPEVIFFGGRMPESMLKLLIRNIKNLRSFYSSTRKPLQPKLRIASAGIDAAALGVASLPLYASFAPLPKLLMQQKGYDNVSMTNVLEYK